ncbi:hypothetical protein L6452_36285 [Arctium lappa]|uniref:Uncharacterized protein n=1 Tax=Arctium lappa TaxID=4217 RepID=A0ACB8Y9F4_ARCLA|nr:hypothetical protein L6452_36285 [Arctium lappa]
MCEATNAEREIGIKAFGKGRERIGGTVGIGVAGAHIEVWVRLHLESRSTLADWSIMLPDFMYYMTELKDLSYLTQQCNGPQGSAGFPTWGTINKANIAGPPLRIWRTSAIADLAPPPERL